MSADVAIDDSMEDQEKQKDQIFKRPAEYRDLYRLLRTLRSDTKSGLGLKFNKPQRQKALWSINNQYPDADSLQLIRIL